MKQWDPMCRGPKISPTAAGTLPRVSGAQVSAQLVGVRSTSNGLLAQIMIVGGLVPLIRPARAPLVVLYGPSCVCVTLCSEGSMHVLPCLVLTTIDDCNSTTGLQIPLEIDGFDPFRPGLHLHFWAKIDGPPTGSNSSQSGLLVQ